MSPAAGFLPGFFQPYRPDPPSVPSAPGARAVPGTSYRPQHDGAHAEFCRGPAFARYRDEMLANIGFVADRARQLGMADAASVEGAFRLLYRRRFEEAFYDTHAEYIDSAGKRALDNFCDALRGGSLPPEKQSTAIRNLATGLSVCASGAVRNLIDADRDLSLSCGGLRARVWRAKEDIVRAVLLEAVTDRLDLAVHIGTEIHFVNALWNHMAYALGLAAVPEPMSAAVLDRDFLALCEDRVLAALTPDRIATRIAVDCLSEFRSRTLFDAASPMLEGEAEWWNIVHGDILRDLGLTTSELGLSAFIGSDEAGLRYHVLDDPSLIALALLKAMHADRLLADAPVQVGEARESDGELIRLYSYGSCVAWRLRQAMQAGEVSWEAHEDVEVIRVEDLRALFQARRGNALQPHPATLARFLRSSDATELASVPAAWLGSRDRLLEVLARLEGQQAVRYLEDNMDWLLRDFPIRDRAAFVMDILDIGDVGYRLGRAWYSHLWLVRRMTWEQATRYVEDQMPVLLTQVPADHRTHFIDRVIHLGPAARSLATSWYPDPWAFLAERDATEDMTRLERWIRSDHYRAIEALAQYLGDWCAGTAGRTPPGAVARAFRTRDGAGMLYEVVRHGSPDTAAAMQGLLRQLLSSPSPINEEFARYLPAMFAGDGGAGFLPLLVRRRAMVIQAVQRMMFEPAVMQCIQAELPRILVGQDPRGAYPMWSMLVGTATAPGIAAYGALLGELATLPSMQPWLPQLLMPTWGVLDAADFARPGKHMIGRYALVSAVTAGDSDAIAAYHAILVLPAMQPYVADVLPQLVAARPGTARRWSSFQAGLLKRLFDARLPGYAAYRDMVGDPRILPFVLPALPPDAHAIRAGLLGVNEPAHDTNRTRRVSLLDWVERLFARFGA
ncbi:hypothetical protein BOBR111200_01485 [Bordetella bronchialis]